MWRAWRRGVPFCLCVTAHRFTAVVFEVHLVYGLFHLFAVDALYGRQCRLLPFHFVAYEQVVQILVVIAFVLVIILLFVLFFVFFIVLFFFVVHIGFTPFRSIRISVFSC